MKSVQFIKQVNNTELGKTGTHETYILVPQEVDISDIFTEVDFNYSFKDKKTNKEYIIRLTIGREKRIVGLGSFYRDNNLHAGDKVLFEKINTDEDSVEYYIDSKKSKNKAYFQKVKGCFESLNSNEIFQLLSDQGTASEENVIRVVFNNEIKKRKDSPTYTKIYDIVVENHKINDAYQNGDVIEISLENQKGEIFICDLWKKYIIEVNE